MVFPTFFNLNLNLAIRSSWSEPQSAPSLAFADCIELFHLWLHEYNQSDFSVGHLMMSLCRTLSCVVGNGYSLWPVCSFGKTLLVFSCFIPYSKAKFAFYSRCFLFLTVAFQSPIIKRTSLLGVSSKMSCMPHQIPNYLLIFYMMPGKVYYCLVIPISL